MGYYGDQYGVVPYGGAASSESALALTSVLPGVVDTRGGHILRIGGIFAGASYQVYLGPTGTAADAACLGVAPGVGTSIEPEDGVLRCVAPAMVRGSMFLLVVGAEGDGVFPLTVCEPAHGEKDFRLRKNLAPWYATGARSLNLEPLVD